MGYDFRDGDKKSFSERDKAQRERRMGGGYSNDQDDRPKNKRDAKAYNNYKDKLDKVFDGGGLPPELQEKLAQTGFGEKAKRQKEMLSRLQKETGKSLEKTLLAHAEEFGFPTQEQALLQLLSLEDNAVVLSQVIEQFTVLQSTGKLTRSNAIKQKLTALAMSTDDDDIAEMIEELLPLL